MAIDNQAGSETTAATKRVRILVAIDNAGKWVSAGYDYGHGSNPKDWILLDDLGVHMAYFWVDADVPIPTEGTIVGKAMQDAE